MTITKQTESKKNTIYAVIKVNSKQYTVEKNSVIDIDYTKTGFSEKNGNVSFSDVLMFCDGENVVVGTPLVKYKVKGTLLAPTAENKGLVLGPKVISYKYKRRQNYHRKRGHRQKYCRVKITEITKG